MNPPASRRRLLSVLLLVPTLAVAFLLLYQRASTPPLPIPTPPNLATLDPQVRAHLAHLAKRIAEAPRDPELRADMGLAFAVNQLWTEARQSFTNALLLGDPRPLPALYAAVALQELGDDPGATRELQEVVRRFPDFAPAWHRLGRALVAAGDLPAATEAFATVTRLAPDLWHGWAGLGEARIRSGSAALALEPLEHARQLAPSARSVRHLLAQAYRATGRTADADREAAAAGASQSLGPMPDDWSVRALDHMKSLSDQFERADALVAAGQATEAVARLREALRYHPTNSIVISTLARALNAADQSPAAWQLLTNALARRPDDVALLARAAETAAALERPDEALALARQALQLAPQSAEARVAEANALLAAHRDADAVAALEQAIALAPRDIPLRLQLGDILNHNLQQPGRARDAYTRAHATDPLHLAPLERLAILALENRDPTGAARWTAELRRLNADPGLLRVLDEALRP